MSTVDPPLRVAPGPEQDRITLLDALRGLSVLGIAFVNVAFFAIPFGRLTSWQWSRVSLAEGLVRCAVTFFAEYHFFAIFTLLFGMGLAIQHQRVQQVRGSFARLWCRRLLILLGFGIAHGILLWYGDILALYALVGFIAFLFRNRSLKTLLVSALALFTIPVLLQVVLMLADPSAQQKTPEEYMDQLLAQIRAQSNARAARAPATQTAPGEAMPAVHAATSPAAPSTQKATTADVLASWIEFLANDERVYRSGTIGQMMLHRSLYFLLFSPLVALTNMGWSALAFMLLGMYMLRRGLFCGSGHSLQPYRRLAIAGMAAGLPLQATGLILHAVDPLTAWVSCLRSICVYLGSIGMSLGYVGIVFLLWQHPIWRQRLGPLIAVGRMSLTNYIGTSFLFGLIFYGYGLGLMGRVSYALTELIALIVLVFLTTFSVIWLKYFRYGPLEWVWRISTYLRILPLRQRAAAV